jgi:PKHD-type hydroxylase
MSPKILGTLSQKEIRVTTMSNIVNYSYWKWDGALSKEFCEFVLGQVDWAAAEKASIYDNTAKQITNAKIRRTDVVWQDVMEPLGCIAKAYIDAANNQAGWGYSITTQESVQIGRYKSVDEGYYDWHIDAAIPKDGVQRKLSISILLSDPSEFEGGELQFKGIEDQKLLTKQGSIVVFPSFIEHTVTPVTKGDRYSAVTWAHGPSFR